MKRIICLMGLGLSLLLGACSVVTVESSGPTAKPLGLAKMGVYFEPRYTPGGQARGDTGIVESGIANVQMFAANIAHPFTATFSDLLAKHGVGLSTAGDGAPVLYVYVYSFDRLCSATDCNTRLEIHGKLLNDQEKELWSFTSYMIPNGMEAADFNKFEASLLEAMIKDGVIAK